MKSSAFTLAAALLACTVLAPVALADPEASTATQAAPTAPATPTATATPAAAPAAASPSAAKEAHTAAAAPAASAAASTGGANLTSEEREKHFKAEGYKVKMRGAQKYFCRVDQPIGSHIPQEQCYTEDVLARAENITPGSSASMGTTSMKASSAPAWASGGGH
jgi:hypothetical protein